VLPRRRSPGQVLKSMRGDDDDDDDDGFQVEWMGLDPPHSKKNVEGLKISLSFYVFFLYSWGSTRRPLHSD